jgi:sodium-dependent dicarboxylate transporter 2/3/5
MKRWYAIAAAAIIFTLVPQLMIESDVHARVVSVAGFCLLLWISEVVPPFVPTLLFWSLVPLLLGTIDGRFTLPNVLTWAVDPVMALFFGGFVLGVAAGKTGLDRAMIRFALRSSAHSYAKFLLFVVGITAFLSMWMSNVAAAALVFACLRPVLLAFDDDHLLRRAVLIGVAFGADFGGMATPIGTGPNAIAIASVSVTQPISFLSWMIFAFPLTISVLAAVYLYLLWRGRGLEEVWANKVGNIEASEPALDARERRSPRTVGTIAIFAATIALWLTEPMHGISAPVVAVCAAAALFASSILNRTDLMKLDWSTLMLIAGGISLGRLLEQSSVINTFAGRVPFGELDPTLSLFLLCLSSAVLSALMSNTATVILLIPLAHVISPQPSTAILVAISASFGMPFLISTPPNAMAFGEGGVRFGDLFWPGIVLMIGGCLVVSLTGRAVLNLAGIP